MKLRTIFILAIAVPFLVTLLSNCDPKDKIVYPPEANFYSSPTQGNTTTVFKFITSQSTNPGTADTMMFFRWDWNNDGIWDTHFTRSRVLDHRFWIKGDYTVVMEVRNEGGLRDTISTDIEIVQGYSPPHAKLIVTPDNSHIRTEYILDASETTDDEDSLSTLLFRWDFEGDGSWNTQWKSDPVITHIYTGPDHYNAIVAVRDPSGLSSRADQIVIVSLNNKNLFVDFNWNPENGTSVDVFTFDASACYDPNEEGNTFTYRWDFDGDDIFDTDYLTNPITEHLFEDEGETSVRLEITDKYGLTNQTVRDLVVEHANRPPKASFFAGAYYGNLTTNFYFDANAVKDDEDWEYQLKVRWNFDSDGTWDTEYSDQKTVYHKFGTEGQFKITMEAIDLGGLTASSSVIVTTTGGTNETGIIIDSDSGDTYGTVKIGTQWWMAENLKNSTNRACYGNSLVNCDIYGGLYTWTNAMAGSGSEKARGLCPQGWHIPTVAEWEKLFDFLGGEENARELLEDGGSSDFRMRYAGQISSSGGSQYAGTVVNYWTSTSASGDNAWAFSLQKDKDQIWKLTLGRSYLNSVRCIK